MQSIATNRKTIIMGFNSIRLKPSKHLQQKSLAFALPGKSEQSLELGKPCKG